jgi:hypothetical protein
LVGESPLPLEPWSSCEMPEAVRRYVRPYRIEFDTTELDSELPYSGPASAVLRRSTCRSADRSGFHRFANLKEWDALWEPRSHAPLSAITADLLATAHALGGRLCYRNSPGGPGGFHVEGDDVWIALLDGGIGVEVELYEHQTTNRVSARQRTTIRGSATYRAVTRAMGFDHVHRRLPGETALPDLEDLDQQLTRMVVDCRQRRARELGSRES